jgi:hypothetical protein
VPLLPVGAPPPLAPVAAPASGAAFGDVLRAQAARTAAPPPTSPGLRLLHGVEQARSRLDAALAEARRGRSFTAGELLALQADAYRAGQALELASRVVEQGAQAVRQAVNAQV